MQVPLYVPCVIRAICISKRIKKPLCFFVSYAVVDTRATEHVLRASSGVSLQKYYHFSYPSPLLPFCIYILDFCHPPLKKVILLLQQFGQLCVIVYCHMVCISQMQSSLFDWHVPDLFQGRQLKLLKVTMF